MMEPQRQPWPKRFTTYILDILTEINMSASGVGKKIVGLANGSAGTQDGCTVKQMEDHITAAIGDNVSKDPVHAATTAALPANTRTGDVLTANVVNAFPTIDGVAAVLNNDYLVKNEGGGASHINNGIYTLTVLGGAHIEWELTRRQDMEGGEGASGAAVPVTEGTIAADTTFKCFNNIGSDVINTDALEFKFWGQTTDHGNLKNVTKDQHHNEDHQARHQSGGADELDIEGLPTSETDFQKLLRVDAITPGDLEFIDYPVKGYAQGLSINPPGAPSDKDLWMIGGSPTGVWVGHANEIGIWNDGGAAWDFYSPTAGDTYWSIAASNYYHFTTAWELFGTLISHTNLKDVTADAHHAQAHKDEHDPEDGGDPLDCAAPGSIDENANAEGTSHSLARADHNHQHLATLHENGGGAEISVTDLSGLLADDQHIIDAEAVAAFLTYLDYQYIESEAEQTETGSSWVLKSGASLSWTPPIAGDYIIEWSMESTNSSSVVPTEALIELDNGGTAGNGTEIGFHSHEPENGDDYHENSGLKKLTLTQAAHRIDVAMRRTGAGIATAKLRRVRITARRVA